MRGVKVLIALGSIFISLPALAADVVVMRDGSERSGTLTMCADDQCRLNGTPIPMLEIRAIFFDGPRKELPVRSSAIVMRDGSVRTGRVTFINRGTVDTDDEEIDRSLVAAILFSVASDKPISDLLILRNGSAKSGTLTACNAASCTLDGAVTPLANIEWVGLAREDVVPPSSTADEVHKIDGTIVAGRLSGINESTVSTTRGPVLREETAWVHLTASAPAPPDQPGSFGAPPPPSPPPPVQPPTSPSPQQQPPPPRPPSPTPRAPNRELVKPCPADRPLGGEINYAHDIADRHFQRCSGSARLWFRLHPNVPVSAYRFGTTWHSDAITYWLKNDGCTDLPDQHGEVCTAPPQDEIRGRLVIGTVGPTGVEQIAGVDWGPVSFDPFTPELSFLTLPNEIRHRTRTPITCVLPSGGGSSGGWEFAVIGEITAPCDSSFQCFVACVQPTLCAHPTELEQKRDCALHPGRYAVIPFVGSQTKVCDDSAGTVVTLSYRWKVCCGCGEPPSGPPPEFSQDPCGDLGVQRGLLQVAVDTSSALRRELRPHLDRFQLEKHQAGQYRNDFDYVSNSCAGWDVAVTLTEALFGGVGAAEGLGPTEGAQAFSKLLSIIQAVIDQDPTIPLTAFLGAAEELEVAGESALAVTLLGIEGFTTSGVIDTVGSITNGALEFLQAGEVQAQRERLEDCTDTPLVAGVTFDGAREYLDHAEAAARELSAALPLMTRIEQSDTNIYNRWAAYHQACLQYAECKGLDPAVCNPPPP
ncbi:MAG: hypothetical protein JJE51_11830 [Thermoanaerobaculia bacterium]|nr:hypothetical protein [Thermoanaerobaculia bacterium]